MHQDEYMSWLAYRNKRGPLNPMMRNDNGFALIAMLINRGLGGKAEISDFLQYGKDEQEEVMTDPMEFIKMFSGVK